MIKYYYDIVVAPGIFQSDQDSVVLSTARTYRMHLCKTALFGPVQIGAGPHLREAARELPTEQRHLPLSPGAWGQFWSPWQARSYLPS